MDARSIIHTDPARATTRRVASPPRRSRPLKRTALYAVLFTSLLIGAAIFGIQANVNSPRSLMSRVDYKEGFKAIEADTRVGLAHCRGLEGKARDVCKAEVRGEDRIGKAELDARYRGTTAADARLARARATYEVAKANCSDLLGEGRIACLKAARAEKDKALADARPFAT